MHITIFIAALAAAVIWWFSWADNVGQRHTRVKARYYFWLAIIATIFSVCWAAYFGNYNV